MNAPVHTRTFKSGNSVAVRLPKGFEILANSDVVIEKTGDVITLRLSRDPAEEKRRVREMLDALKLLPKPPYIEKREPFEFPDRPGL